MFITLEVEPRALPRARHTVRGKYATSYYTKANNQLFDDYKIAILKALKSLGHTKLPIYDKTVRIALKLTFYMKLPTSWSKKKRDMIVNDYHMIKPDIDNLIKMVLDRASDLIWADDYNIVKIEASKVYSEKPRIEIETTLI